MSGQILNAYFIILGQDVNFLLPNLFVQIISKHQVLQESFDITWVLSVCWAPVKMGLLGGDGGCAAIRASGRHHGGWGGGGRVVTGDLAGDGAKLGHGDGTQAGALGHRGRRWGHYKRGEPVWAAFIFNLLYWTHHYTCSLCAQCPRFFFHALVRIFLHSSFFTIYLILVWAKGQKHGYEIYIFSKAICLRHFFHYYNVTEYTRVNLHPVSFLKKQKKNLSQLLFQI